MHIYHFADGQKGYDQHHMQVLHAFYDGCIETGIKPRLIPFSSSFRDDDDIDYAVIFGTYKKALPWSEPRKRIMERQARFGKRTVVIDSGYVKREKYYMVGLDGLNGRADFRVPDIMQDSMPGDRWEQLGVELKPKREDRKKNHVLLCGQVPWDASVQDTDHLAWLQEMANKLTKATNRTVIFSRHPLSPKEIHIRGVQNINIPCLDLWLKGCHVTVCFNSNSGVESVIAGVPTLSFDPGSMVWEISQHHIDSIEDPYFPEEEERRRWAHALAYCQWHIDEIKSGEAVKHILGLS